MKKFGILISISLLVLGLATSVYAIDNYAPCGDAPGLSDAARKLCVDLADEGSLIYLILKLIGLMRNIFWILVVLMIFYSAYLYLIEGGSSGKVDKANQMLKYTVIAIIIALVATSIPYLIRSILS